MTYALAYLALPVVVLLGLGLGIAYLWIRHHVQERLWWLWFRRKYRIT